MPKDPSIEFERRAKSILGRIAELTAAQDHSERLVAFRSLGELTQSVTSERSATHQLKNLGELIGRSGDFLSRVRKLAVAFSEDELRAAIELAPAAELKHFSRLAGVADKKMRLQLTKELGAGQWNVRRLHREIQLCLGKRRKGGRPRTKRKPIEAVVELNDQIADAHRLWTAHSTSITKGLTTRQLRDAVQGLHDSLRSLQADVRKALNARV